MKSNFETGMKVHIKNTPIGDFVLLSPAPLSALIGSSYRVRGLECYVGEGFYHITHVNGDGGIVHEDDLEPYAFSGASFVYPSGDVFRFTIAGDDLGPDDILLENGDRIRNADPAYMFATRESAFAMSDCIRKHGYGEKAVACHRAWVDGRMDSRTEEASE